MPAPEFPSTTRRRLISLAATAPAAAALGGASAWGQTRDVKAMAFDAFALFDPRPVFARARALVPARGDALRELWFQKLFAYTWLRSTAQRYVGFADVIAESLDFAARGVGVTLSASDRDDLLASFWNLPAWPDADVHLARWRAQGLRLVMLSNMSAPMMQANLRRNGLEHQFEALLSTDRARAFKPSPKAYALAPAAMNLPTARIAFVAFASWDAIGASWFGFPTAWVNRLGQPAEAVAAPTIPTGGDFTVVDDVVQGRAAAERS